jgi:hypothetical protein
MTNDHVLEMPDEALSIEAIRIFPPFDWFAEMV